MMSASSIPRITTVPGARRFQFDCLHATELKAYGAISLYQFGDLTCDVGFQLSNHKQICYEISYIVAGKGWFATNGVRHDLQAGDLYIGVPGELHSGGTVADDPFRYFYLGFHFNENEPAYHPFLLIKEMMDHKESPRCNDRFDIRTPFAGVLKELSSASPFSQPMIQSYLEQILVMTYRNFFSDWDAKYPGEGMENAAKRAVYAAIYYIDNHLLKIEDLKEVSDAFGYSLSYLSHLFTKETGDSLRHYYTKRKWEKAIELMKEGQYSVTEVAGIMRYDSIHTFSRAFRKWFGLSPTHYFKNVIGKDRELSAT
ncbi:MAG: AraC family transcriptional regulator [Paenibacillus sp.]|jgi:AraC-like DNA-binding protein|nr:AraC family transcriptional regulator [Paenibacillus sp.]